MTLMEPDDSHRNPQTSLCNNVLGLTRSYAAEAELMAQLIPYDDRAGWIWLDGEMVPWRDGVSMC